MNKEEPNMEPTPEQVALWRQKAEKWDALGKAIDAHYEVDDEGELVDKEVGNLLDIGETAAIAFGYL